MILRKLIRHIATYRIVPILYTLIKAAFSRHRLPPGKFVSLAPAERSDQKFLLKQSQEIGPIFRATMGRRFCVCIVGLPLCRHFLKEHTANVTPVTMEFERLFPKGFLRKMKGEDHKKYRSSLMRAIDSEVIVRDKSVLEKIIIDGLTNYTASQQEKTSPPGVYIKTLNNIASSSLIYIFFGARFGTQPFETLIQMYNKLGPNGLEWFLGEKQKETFNEIRDYLLELLNKQKDNDNTWLQQSILGRMHQDGALDETSLGNLIYMVEMGRFDLYSLFRWISKYAAENSTLLERISAETPENQQSKVSLSKAFVMETLRLNQIERLMRIINRDIIFEGYLIPKHSTVRLCLWESHKSSDTFPEPFSFNLERFTTQTVTKDQFSPFGLDHHNCPFADISTEISSLFISGLAKGYTLTSIADGPPSKERYHWQPPKQFSVRLKER